METPICDFLEKYAKSGSVRLHMPGHKGKSLLGFEKYDITEIQGADSLYTANGIIRESEENASKLFGSGATFYSCEGSSLCIRSMLYLAKMYANDRDGYVLAGRNAHSSFISACALNDIEVKWLYPLKGESYLSCTITADSLESALRSVDKAPFCVYVTSPDYLGNMCDIASLSQVCKKYGTMLIVDNAHGSYLKFLEKDMHPISNGATMCCDSAHKTLPCITGGAYLHISRNAPDFFKEQAKSALAFFGSTSPSYLILASLDKCNEYISNGYKEKLSLFAAKVNKLFSKYNISNEALKITIDAKKYGYTGTELALALKEQGAFCEFYDKDYLVIMLTPENTDEELARISHALGSALKKEVEYTRNNVLLSQPKRVMSIREATFAKKELVSIDKAKGRILAGTSITCPPAVSLIVSGEELDQNTIDLCKEYGINNCYVVSLQEKQ